MMFTKEEIEEALRTAKYIAYGHDEQIVDDFIDTFKRQLTSW